MLTEIREIAKCVLAVVGCVVLMILVFPVMLVQDLINGRNCK